MTERDRKRFWARVDIRAEDECWLWKPSRNPNSTPRYGRFYCCGVHHPAHRLSLEMLLGRPLRPGLETRHLCGNNLCVNPAHLAEGTGAENAQDRWAHETQHYGSSHHNAKLTEYAVLRIRELYRTGDYSLVELANEFAVSKKLILNIVKGRAWRQVEACPVTLETQQVETLLERNRPRGCRHGMSRLSECDVRLVRQLYSSKQSSLKELSEKFGVTTQTIWRAATFKGWSHVK